MGAGRQVLGLGHAVHRVVVGLADHRAVDTEPVADRGDRGDPPGAIIGDSEMTDLALANQITHRRHRRLERRVVVLLVEVIDIDVVGAETLQARIARLDDPFARQAALVRSVAHRVAQLGGEEPAITLLGDRRADDLFGAAVIIGVGGIDEVDPGVARLGDDALARRRVGAPAEHHRAEADRRDLEPGAAEQAVIHGVLRWLTLHKGLGRQDSATE